MLVQNIRSSTNIIKLSENKISVNLIMHHNFDLLTAVETNQHVEAIELLCISQVDVIGAFHESLRVKNRIVHSVVLT